MPGRKTIMVDETIWNKIDDYKHDRRLRSIGDAISSALESATSKKYYAGIRALHDSEGTFYHVVESLGRTEEDAVRRLIEFEAELAPECDELRPEDIPPASETDIYEEGYFIVECTEKMYLKGLLRTYVNEGCEAYEMDHSGPFYCHITRQKNGDYLADIDEKRYYVAYIPRKLPEGTSSRYEIGEIVNCADTELLFAWYNDCFMNCYVGNEEVDLPKVFNPHDICVVPCTPRLYAECLDVSFRPPCDNWEDEYSNLRPEFFCRIHGGEADTTPSGKLYTVISPLSDGQYAVLKVGETANKASQDYMAGKSGCDADEPWWVNDTTLWKDVYPSGERIGKWKDFDILLVECTRELYCQVLASETYIEDDEGELTHTWSVFVCEIEGEVGERIAHKAGSPSSEALREFSIKLKEKIEEKEDD